MAAQSIQDMAAKGQRKFAAKAAVMANNYNASKARAQANFEALPFGPNTKAAYRAGLQAAQYRTPDAAKWSRNWQAAVSR